MLRKPHVEDALHRWKSGVRYWPKAEMTVCAALVRFRE
jgi:hypothetical protein